MPESIVSILERLDRLAAYDGPWRPLRQETELLKNRLEELRERESRLDDLLVVALVGGSGVGKSTLLNAIAGDQLAKTSEFRPCTCVPTVYHPPGAQISFPEWTSVSGSALEHLIIIDTPDSDTVVREHRGIVETVLAKCDLIMVCGSPDKYLDEATWSLLRPLRNERTLVCVETKASDGAAQIKEHWLARMTEQGLKTDGYFRVRARRTLDRKIAGMESGDDEFDWPRLETFLKQELTRERIKRIKRSNAMGLLTKTIRDIAQRMEAARPSLDLLPEKASAANEQAAIATFKAIRSRLFSEPHLWNHALGREIALRAKGVTGTCYRLLEATRGIPTRLAAWIPGLRKSGTGPRAASLLAGQTAFGPDLAIAYDDVRSDYESIACELRLEFARAGFDLSHEPGGYDAYMDTVGKRVSRVLRGPARDRLAKRANFITSWPVSLLADAAPLGFLGFSCYRIVTSYFADIILPVEFLLHSLAVLAIILGGELLAISIIARALAWSARTASTRDLRIAIGHPARDTSPERPQDAATPFAPEVAMLDEARALALDAQSLLEDLARGVDMRP